MVKVEPMSATVNAVRYYIVIRTGLVASFDTVSFAVETPQQINKFIAMRYDTKENTFVEVHVRLPVRALCSDDQMKEITIQ